MKKQLLKPLLLLLLMCAVAAVCGGGGNSTGDQPVLVPDATCGTDGINDSCTPAVLTSLIGSAADEDVIAIATGTHTWNSPVIVNRPVTITGWGSCPDCGENNPAASSIWPTELLIDSTSAFIVSDSSGGPLVRITGLSFNGPGPVHDYTDGANTGIIAEDTDNRTAYRFDNLRFTDNVLNRCVFRTNSIDVYGVIDHVNSVNTALSGGRFFHSTGHGDDGGSTDWSRETVWGSADFDFVEDSTIIFTTENSISPGICLDQQGGGRAVYRNNYLQNCDLGNHGTESGWPSRSGIAQEAYGNEIVWTGDPSDRYHTALLWRGGSIYFHDNTVRNFQSIVKMNIFRVGGDILVPPVEMCGDCGTLPDCENHDGFLGTPVYPIGYPCLDQHGMGKTDGVGLDQSQPQEYNKAHIWNNTLDGTGWGAEDGVCILYENEKELANCDPEYIVKGRDFEYSEDASAAPPGYTPYTYPHPLTTIP
jgi:hypothetical protein